MSNWVELGIGVGGAVAGALVGFGGSLIVSHQERKAAAKSERQRAYSAYLGALYPIVGELRVMPNVDDLALPDLLGKLKSILPNAEATEWLRARRAVGDRPSVMSAQLASSFATLQVLDVADEVRAVLSEANEYVIALSEKRTRELIDGWPDLHGRLEAAIGLL